jgi:hypothetical protein
MPITPPEPNPGRGPRAADESKKRYEAPRLTDYGPVSKLTQTGGITTMDMNSMQVCL